MIWGFNHVLKSRDEKKIVNVLGFSKKNGTQFSWSVDHLPPFSLEGEVHATTPFLNPFFLSRCWTVVHGQGDEPGNIFTLQLTPPCGAFIWMVLSDAICPLSPHPPKIAPRKGLRVQHPAQLRDSPSTDNPTCGLAALPC